MALAQAVRMRVLKRRQGVDSGWRRQIDRDASSRPDPASPVYRGDDLELADIRRLCRPPDIHIQLVPTD